MAYRRPANGRSDKRSFTRNAMRVNPTNRTMPRRGGYRL